MSRNRDDHRDKISTQINCIFQEYPCVAGAFVTSIGVRTVCILIAMMRTQSTFIYVVFYGYIAILENKKYSSNGIDVRTENGFSCELVQTILADSGYQK